MIPERASNTAEVASAPLGLLSIEAACRRAAAYAGAVDGLETLPLFLLPGRTLARNIEAAHACPPFAQSAMDGYAVATGGGLLPGTVLAVVGRVAAGQAGGPITAGAASRIFTGAPLPPGADAVVMQERVDVLDGGIALRDPVRAGEHVRRMGEDVTPGSLLVEAGIRLDARHVALLAAQGLAALEVRRRLRVALASTGDELLAPGGLPGAGTGIFDSNRPMLLGLLARAGHDVIDVGCVPDDPASLAGVLASLADHADLIVTTGGVSVGEEDHSATALARAGGIGETLRIALKPGKPALVGRVGAAAYLGLPGNPVSALVSWSLLGRAMVGALEGRPFQRPLGLGVALAGPLLRKAGRTEFMPARLATANGEPMLQVLGSTSARLRPLVDADGFVEVPAHVASAQSGTRLPFHAFERLLAP
ncbi:MAG TPA: gephyrin-like molybdotransferase Glp [Salinarimonas sp.]|nr:gephyrin-like molybdotransferase Glp [Salinarimonas sp.]